MRIGLHRHLGCRVALAIVAALGLTLMLATAASASLRARAAGGSGFVGSIAPSTVASNVDCNGWSGKYPPIRPAMRALCTDPAGVNAHGKPTRFLDNGWYVGHDEPSVKFISSARGSGNTMTYFMQLPHDPAAAPTPSGSVTDYAELSSAPWFGLPMCDPNSFPQNRCKPDSDKNTGAFLDPKAAGSAFMELQFYPPGFTPWFDSPSCDKTKWCSALTIDSLECDASGACNGNCVEPLNFAWLQRDGVPSGPPAPQTQNVNSVFPNRATLMMNPDDVLEVSISDPRGGLLIVVRDLTTGQTGFMQASARNGFANTNIADCSGNPFTFHAEYNTARQQNQNPWALLEGGVLMEQELGHFESCNSLANLDGTSQTFADGSTFVDPSVYQTCVGGVEGRKAVGEGPCNPMTGLCINSTTEGPNGPEACPTNDAGTGALCEFADGYCMPQGTRTVLVNGNPVAERWRVTGCESVQFQNGDLDFDGNPYQPNAWPNGSSNVPTSIRYAGPFTHGQPYPNVQLETNVGGSANLCDPGTGTGCTVPPVGARFYPFWTVAGSQGSDGGASQSLGGSNRPVGGCMWNFGNVIPGSTVNDLGRFREYGSPDVARFGGTLISAVQPNPALGRGCGRQSEPRSAH